VEFEREHPLPQKFYAKTMHFCAKFLVVLNCIQSIEKGESALPSCVKLHSNRKMDKTYISSTTINRKK